MVQKRIGWGSLRVILVRGRRRGGHLPSTSSGFQLRVPGGGRGIVTHKVMLFFSRGAFPRAAAPAVLKLIFHSGFVLAVWPALAWV